MNAVDVYTKLSTYSKLESDHLLNAKAGLATNNVFTGGHTVEGVTSFKNGLTVTTGAFNANEGATIFGTQGLVVQNDSVVGGRLVSNGPVQINNNQPTVNFQRGSVSKFSILVNPTSDSLQIRTVGNLNALTIQQDSNIVCGDSCTFNGSLTVQGTNGLRIGGTTGAEGNNAILRFWNNTDNQPVYSMYCNYFNNK